MPIGTVDLILKTWRQIRRQTYKAIFTVVDIVADPVEGDVPAGDANAAVEDLSEDLKNNKEG